MPPMSTWYLRKPDGSTYGPITLEDLCRWAAESRIVAGNEVSSDEEKWIKVEDIEELEMQWVAVRPDGKEYGPFNIGATRDLVAHGVLPEDIELKNRISGKTALVSSILVEDSEALQKQESPPPKRSTPPKKKKTTQKSPPAADDDNKSSLVQLEEKFAAFKKQAAQQTKLLTEERDALDMQLKELQEASTKELQRATDRNVALKTNLEEMEADLANTRQEQSRLRTRIKQVDTARKEAENAAVEDVAEIRKQSAFMKKNNATLRLDLDTAQRRSRHMTRAFALLIAGNVLVAFIAMLTRGCDETGATDTPPPDDSQPAAMGSSATPDGDTEAAATATRRSRKKPAKNPTQPQPWPTIDVDGIAVTQRGTIQTMTFSQGFFGSMTTPSGWGRSRLEAIAEQLAPHIAGFTLVVEGHTDDRPLRNSTQYNGNAALALARAKAAATLLTTEYAFPVDCLKVVAAEPKTAPYPNDTAENRKKNRTIVLKLTRKR